MRKNAKAHIITNSVTWYYKENDAKIITEKDNKTERPRIIFNELSLKYDNIVDFNQNNADLMKIRNKLKRFKTKNVL